MKGNFLSEEFAEYPFDVTAYSPPSVSLLRVFLFYYYYYYVFFSFSSRLHTHTHTLTYSYPLYIVHFLHGGGVHFLPATSKLEYILYFIHTRKRCTRTLYIISTPTDRQIVRLSSPRRYLRLYYIIHDLLKPGAGKTCTRTLHKCRYMRVLFILQWSPLYTLYNVPMYNRFGIDKQ